MSSQAPVPSGLALIDNCTIRFSDVLAKLFLSAQSADIHVAYLRSSGVKLLEPELQYFLRKDHTLRVLAGGDFGLTEPEALRQLQEWGAQVRLYASADVAGFHPKSYRFHRADGRVALIVGSSNFSRGGLADNVELNLMLQLDQAHPVVQQAVAIFERLWDNTPELTEEGLAHYQAFRAERAGVSQGMHYLPPQPGPKPEEVTMTQDIQPGDKVRVGERVGEVIKVEPLEGATMYRIFFEGEGARPFISPPTTLEKVADPLSAAKALDFDPPHRFDLLSQATLLSLAYEHDHLLSLSNSRTNLEPYQVEAVYRVLSAYQQRFLIADDVGLGKTIEAGMIMKELVARGRAKRVLIVVPAPLQLQWQREMREKFGEHFWIYNSSKVFELRNFLSRGANPWDYEDRIITSIDYVKREEILPELGVAQPWDLIIFDEAHKLSVSKYGSKIDRTQRYRVGTELHDDSDSLLLLTATPHKGDPFAFYSLIELLDPYLFVDEDHIDPVRLNDVMIRRGKDRLRREDGRPVFPPRFVDVVPIRFSAQERALYSAVTRYVINEYNLASAQRNRTVGFAMIVLQKRMVSSIGAIRKSLRNRLTNLISSSQVVLSREDETRLRVYSDDPDLLEESERESLEHRLEVLTLAPDAAGLQQEVQRLRELGQMADGITLDGKAQTLVQFIRGVLEKDPREKILVFTEYRDTLDYLWDVLADEFGIDCMTQIHGGLDMPTREQRETLFRQPEINILLATDAAGEGINLQFCHIMINYELPWNPNRIDQRIGRLHRYGQERDVYVHNLQVEDTYEGQIFIRLQEKINTIERQLGGRLSEVLGALLEGVDLEGLIMQAVAGNRPVEVTARDIEQAIDERLRTWEQVESSFLMPLRDFDLQGIMRVINRSQEVTASNADIEAFIRRFFTAHDGRIENTRRRDVYRLYPPRQVQVERRVPAKIEQAAFDKEVAKAHPPHEVEFVAFGHPLLETVVTFCRDRDGNFGGGASLKIIPDEKRKGQAGALFNFVLRNRDASGALLSEDLLALFINPEGEIDEAVGRQLIWAESDETWHRYIGEPAIADVVRRLDMLYADALAHAQALSEEKVAEVQARRQREIRIQQADAERYFAGRAEVAERRLREYERRAYLEGEDMTILIRREKSILENLDRRKRERLEELERQRAVYAQAPELLNVAVIKFV